MQAVKLPAVQGDLEIFASAVGFDSHQEEAGDRYTCLQGVPLYKVSDQTTN